ncbi:glycosyltransferase family 39 protein [Geothrix sp. PMB-07]|uniref:glycosyltransferase family 39 protein n=1 Tax=Geothrix sp. PMB-07 TaxID=3068640 RepID=UPI0027407548|nr:glycosyltransferase family 39 protein [Geothrix sp. PMB-07]WLT30538.1 glycosyltransferase family 39 protein [Geothrix sp. PMB-07]
MKSTWKPGGESGAHSIVEWSIGPMDWRLVALLAGLKLLVHLLSSQAYGFFRDELYFLDCARHLGWGYVDDAPMIALLAKVSLGLGGSLPAVRLLPALAGAAKVALGMGLARQMGGGRFAQGLTGLCLLGVPVFLGTDSILCVGAFEPLLWMGCAAMLIELVRTGNDRLWLWFGLLAGLGLETKYAMLVFGLAALVAILLSPLRRDLRRPWIWAAGLLALLIFLPTLLWQIRHGYPLLEDMANIRRMGKNVVLGPWTFVKQQIGFLNPLLFPIWFSGLCSLLFGRLSRLRVLGLLYLGMLALMIALQAKDYYLAAIYPMLFAAGAVATEAWLAGRDWSRGRLWPKVVLLSGIGAVTALLIPALLPFLSPPRLLAYQRALGIRPAKLEVRHDGPLDQRLGDQFGWPEMTDEVARIYHSLTPEEQAHTAIYAASYGEAGAINHLGPARGLPSALCAHQAHSFWPAPDRDYTTFICLGCDEGLSRVFESVQVAAVHHHPWGMAEENRPIYLCRGPKRNIRAMWPELKHWD